MKRLFAILLTVALLLSTAVIGVSATTPTTNWAGQITDADKEWYGDGTATEFTISNAAELAYLATLVSEGTNAFAGKTITLDSNIDLTGYLWSPIGNNSEFFQGMFNGAGYTISGMTINNTTDGTNQQALFGVISGSTADFAVGVKNLKLTGCNVTDTANEKVALVVGQVYVASGNIPFVVENIYAEGTINANRSSGVRVGGIVGQILHKGTGGCVFRNIVCDVDITSTAVEKARVAGIAGNVNSQTTTTVEISDCLVIGTFKGTQVGVIGALFEGANEGNIVQNCVAISSTEKVAGSIKTNYTVKNCVLSKNVTDDIITKINAAYDNAWANMAALKTYEDATAVIQKAIKAYNTITLENGLFAVQTSAPASEAFNARFLAKVKSCEGKAVVGFTVTINGVSKDYNTTKVYESIIAENDLGLTDVVTVTNLNAAGFFAVSVKGLPANGTVTVTISTYSQETVGGDKTVIDNYTVTFTDGAFVSCVPVTQA